jgi:hypothetical protein
VALVAGSTASGDTYTVAGGTVVEGTSATGALLVGDTLVLAVHKVPGIVEELASEGRIFVLELAHVDSQSKAAAVASTEIVQADTVVVSAWEIVLSL